MTTEKEQKLLKLVVQGIDEKIKTSNVNIEDRLTKLEKRLTEIENNLNQLDKDQVIFDKKVNLVKAISTFVLGGFFVLIVCLLAIIYLLRDQIFI